MTGSNKRIVMAGLPNDLLAMLGTVWNYAVIDRNLHLPIDAQVSWDSQRYVLQIRSMIKSEPKLKIYYREGRANGWLSTQVNDEFDVALVVISKERGVCEAYDAISFDLVETRGIPLKHKHDTGRAILEDMRTAVLKRSYQKAILVSRL